MVCQDQPRSRPFVQGLRSVHRGPAETRPRRSTAEYAIPASGQTISGPARQRSAMNHNARSDSLPEPREERRIIPGNPRSAATAERQRTAPAIGSLETPARPVQIDSTAVVDRLADSADLPDVIAGCIERDRCDQRAGLLARQRCSPHPVQPMLSAKVVALSNAVVLQPFGPHDHLGPERRAADRPADSRPLPSAS